MNACAIRLEEQIISLFSQQETELYQGWILKKEEKYLCVYPLYSYYPDHNILQAIQRCEEIGQQNGLECLFRIAEYTNYHLASILLDQGYHIQKSCLVGEFQVEETKHHSYPLGKKEKLSVTDVQETDALFFRQINQGMAERIIAQSGVEIGFRQQELLFLPDGRYLESKRLEQILCFSQGNGISRIVVNLPGQEDLPKDYEELGCHKAYRYRCYGK